MAPTFASYKPHVPELQAKTHELPHTPQLAVVLRLVSQPLAGFPSQSPKPGLHDVMKQAPLEQLEAALGSLHVLPHAPQLAGSAITLASQPSAGFQ